MMLEDNGLDDIVCRELNIQAADIDLTEWKEMLDRINNCRKEVHIALVGKYVKLHDAYLSVVEALHHGGYENGTVVEIVWVDSEQLDETNVDAALAGCDGIIVPGGFGDRGIEGMGHGGPVRPDAPRPLLR